MVEDINIILWCLILIRSGSTSFHNNQSINFANNEIHFWINNKQLEFYGNPLEIKENVLPVRVIGLHVLRIILILFGTFKSKKDEELGRIIGNTHENKAENHKTSDLNYLLHLKYGQKRVFLMGKKSLWCNIGFHDLCSNDCKCSCHKPRKLSGGF